MKKISLSLATGLVMLAAFICVPQRASAEETSKNKKVQSNVFVDNMDMSGKTGIEVKQAVLDYVDEYYKGKVAVVSGQKKTEVNVSDLGLEWVNTDIADRAVGVGREGNIVSRYKQLQDLEHEPIVLHLEFTVDEEMVRKVIGDVAKDFNQESVPVGIKRVNNEFVVTEGEQGIVVNEEKSFNKVKEHYFVSWLSKDEQIELESEIEEPKGSVEELKKIKDCIGAFSTVCGTGATGRIQNIINGVAKINGAVVYPGEEFSADAAMTPYNAENGYALGGAYENGVVVQSYGGGICQVSSTLYNAVILAELEVTQRANHSMTVSYVPLSMDAAIAGTWKDLKFVNNTDTPIYIEGYVKGGVVYFNLYGKETRPSNRTIEYISETLSSTPAPVTINAVDAPFGSKEVASGGQDGYKAKLWKVVYIDGKEVSREEVNSSDYKPGTRVINIGVQSDNAAAVGALRDAIAANSESVCDSIIAQYGAPAEPEAPATPEPEAPAPEVPQPEAPQPETPQPEEGQQ